MRGTGQVLRKDLVRIGRSSARCVPWCLLQPRRAPEPRIVAADREDDSFRTADGLDLSRAVALGALDRAAVLVYGKEENHRPKVRRLLRRVGAQLAERDDPASGQSVRAL